MGAMPVLSDAPGTIPRGASRDVYVPFSCYLRIVPIRGKRFETVFDAQKMAATVEHNLDVLCAHSGSEDLVFDYTKPIAYTPQFGDKTAQLSFHGNCCRRDSFTKLPVGERLVINDGQFKTGAGASNASNRIPNPELDVLASDFIALVQQITGLEVIKLDLNGYIYGAGGTHIP
jgi:hypothetical protein